MEKFVIIGENIHTTRIVLRDGKRHKTLQNGEEIILYVDSEGNQNNISVPDWFKKTLDLEKELNPFHWTDYTFYNGGPKRWFVMRNFLECKQNQKLVSAPLQKAVNVIKRRNTLAQRIGEKNDYIKTLAYDANHEQKLVENDGLFQYGLFIYLTETTPLPVPITIISS